MKTLLAASAALALSACALAPAHAAGGTCPTMQDVIGVLEADNTRYVVVDADKVQKFVDEVAEPVLGHEVEGVTNVLLANLNGVMVFGLEIDGCFSNPYRLPVPAPAAQRQSGRSPDGSIHA